MKACFCPNCGGDLNFDEKQLEKGFGFCQYCGSKIILDDYRSTHTHRVVDEAKIKEAELQHLIKLKELEIQAKEMESKRAGRKASLRMALIIFIIGWLVSIVTAPVIGLIGMVISGWIAISTATGENRDWKK